jgi:hypothetical protein
MSLNFPIPLTLNETFTGNGIVWKWDGYVWDIDYPHGVNLSSHVTNSQTGAFYAASNPSGFITGVNLSSHVTNSQTGQFYAASNPSGFIRNTQTGAFYAASNPSGFITSPGSIISRGTASVTTTSITASGTFNGTVDFGCKSYGLLSVSGASGAWVKLYYDTASRTNDSTRTIDQDPGSNVSLMAECLSTGTSAIRFAPTTIGYNEGTSNLIPIAIGNTRNTAATYTVTFDFLKLEL